MDTPAINIKNLTYFYRNPWTYKASAALSNLTLKVPQGCAFGLIGHNGAGKTTTIKCILDLIKASTGEIEIFGINTKKKESRKAVGYLAELPYFYDYLTVKELLETLAILSDITSSQVKSTIREALSAVNFTKSEKTPLKNLSKGQLQRIALAQAIMHKPRLLILDEPFSGLDPLGRNDFIELLRNLKANGTTIFISSHILNDVEQLCDDVAILKDGSLKGTYSLKELGQVLDNKFELTVATDDNTSKIVETFHPALKVHGDLQTLIFDDEKNAKSALAQALVLGVRIESYQITNGGLQELFLKLVKEEVED